MWTTLPIHVLCHWALLTPPSDLFIVGTQAESFKSFWASELRKLLQGRSIDLQGTAPTNGHSDQNVPDFVTVLEWAHHLCAALRRWGIDPSGWLNLSDHLQAKLFCLNERLADIGLLWYRFDGPWPEDGETWALKSYRCLLAQRDSTPEGQQCLTHS